MLAMNDLGFSRSTGSNLGMLIEWRWQWNLMMWGSSTWLRYLHSNDIDSGRIYCGFCICVCGIVYKVVQEWSAPWDTITPWDSRVSSITLTQKISENIWSQTELLDHVLYQKKSENMSSPRARVSERRMILHLNHVFEIPRCKSQASFCADIPKNFNIPVLSQK